MQTVSGREAFVECQDLSKALAARQWNKWLQVWYGCWGGVLLCYVLFFGCFWTLCFWVVLGFGRGFGLGDRFFQCVVLLEWFGSVFACPSTPQKRRFMKTYKRYVAFSYTRPPAWPNWEAKNHPKTSRRPTDHLPPCREVVVLLALEGLVTWYFFEAQSGEFLPRDPFLSLATRCFLFKGFNNRDSEEVSSFEKRSNLGPTGLTFVLCRVIGWRFALADGSFLGPIVFLGLLGSGWFLSVTKKAFKRVFKLSLDKNYQGLAF